MLTRRIMKRLTGKRERGREGERERGNFIFSPFSLSILILLLLPLVAAAQPVDSWLTEMRSVAEFQDARALAADPMGRLYVVDGGQDAVFQLDARGVLLETLGGSGTGEGQFDQPQDVDPTNGLVLLVADAGNNRLQRFSRTFLPLGSIPVGRVDRFAPGAESATLNIGSEGGVQEADGRPIAVITNNATETFAIDANNNVVLKWDVSRRFERVIGGFNAGDGALEKPVALAADGQSLYVADRGHEAVLVYDAFGSYVRTLAPDLAQEVRAVSVAGNELWIVLPHHILVYSTRGDLLRTFAVRLGDPLVDVQRVGDTLYLLTSSRLYIHSIIDDM